jgi:Zn-dependent peptidase ImmA (M78 family)
MSERIALPNPSRLAWCMQDQGLTRADLAEMAAVKDDVLEAALDGDAALSIVQLNRLAKALDKDVLFFLEPQDVDEARAHTPQFRTLANQKPEMSQNVRRLIERVEKQRETYLHLREELGEDSAVEAFNPPILTGMTIEKKAAAVRKWLGLGDAKNSFATYRDAIEARGILVIRSNGYAGSWQIGKESAILGFSLFDARCPVIVVKKLASEAQLCFTLMHELAHILLHKTSAVDDEKDLYSYKGMEQEANAFAGFLLVPTAFLASIDDKARPSHVAEFEPWLAPQTKSWGISTEVILRRLLDTQRLPQALYTEYRAMVKQRVVATTDGGMRHRFGEPRHIFGNAYVRTVLGALSAREITLNKASTYLDNIKIADLHKLEKHYANT